jgi:hypothetical protein
VRAPSRATLVHGSDSAPAASAPRGKKVQAQPMKHLGIVTAGLLSAALAASCATTAGAPYYTTTTTETVVSQAPRWQDPTYFDARVQNRMNEIESRVRADVATGRVSTLAIDDLIAQKQQIQSVLAQVGADGVVYQSERDYVRQLVANMEGIPQRFALYPAGAAVPYGGGPIHDDTWWY